MEAALDAREASGSPCACWRIRWAAVLARTMQLERPEVWQRMMAHPGARLLMLGTPNGGSWAPMQVLSGDDTFGNALVAFGAPFQDGGARALMARFPGFIQLQAALLDNKLALDQARHVAGARRRRCQARAREQLVAPRGTADRGVYLGRATAGRA